MASLRMSVSLTIRCMPELPSVVDGRSTIAFPDKASTIRLNDPRSFGDNPRSSSDNVISFPWFDLEFKVRRCETPWCCAVASGITSNSGMPACFVTGLDCSRIPKRTQPDVAVTKSPAAIKVQAAHGMTTKRCVSLPTVALFAISSGRGKRSRKVSRRFSGTLALAHCVAVDPNWILIARIPNSLGIIGTARPRLKVLHQLEPV